MIAAVRGPWRIPPPGRSTTQRRPTSPAPSAPRANDRSVVWTSIVSLELRHEDDRIFRRQEAETARRRDLVERDVG